MSERPFHHGSLRTTLLERAEVVVRERGLDALSLRELAREIGVSHGAPRTHFIDRQALLDALAARGFDRLADAMRAAAAGAPDEPAAALLATAHAYVDFAVVEVALLDLMFASHLNDSAAAVHLSAARFFATIRDLVGEWFDAGALAGHDAERVSLLISATMQGIATFTAAGRVDRAQSDALIADAVTNFLRVDSGTRPGP